MQEFWIAIPDSALSDSDTIEEKSRKAAFIARSISIFRVTRVIIYHEDGSDGKLLKLILEFMNTPPYLRKKLYRRMPELKASGLFEPLKTPHHKPYKRLEDVKIGEIRQGIVVRRKGMLYADLGLDRLIPLESNVKERTIINAIITSEYPNLRCRVAKDEEIKEYWGYDVIFYSKLSNILEKFSDLIILTSRKGKLAYKYEDLIRDESKKNNRIIIVFGSTKKGIHEILRKEGYSKRLKHVYNFFPEQGVETIRLEEAILGSLAILNHIIHKNFNS
ncbi:MAG: methylase [Candidatus Nitrosothermus koennekii]|nr:MAG: methylase [Candidatus Nitrosothermus koennekii]